MKIVCISDTHEQFFALDDMPEGDLLIHSGDFTNIGAPRAIIEFNNWLGEIKHKYKYGIVLIAGNHDFLFEKNYYYAKSLITNATYLQDDRIIINNYKIYGSPWQPRFYDWAFNVDRGEMIKKIWNKIPEDTDILITHGPPYEIRDFSIYNHGKDKNVGCKDLLEVINTKLKNLKLHVFGHIHHDYGTLQKNNILYVNASSCNEKYKLINKPIELILS
jgi:Icc-related predicted phosphoesterase